MFKGEVHTSSDNKKSIEINSSFDGLNFYINDGNDNCI